MSRKFQNYLYIDGNIPLMIWMLAMYVQWQRCTIFNATMNEKSSGHSLLPKKSPFRNQ
jgi:hypothetical protein